MVEDQTACRFLHQQTPQNQDLVKTMHISQRNSRTANATSCLTYRPTEGKIWAKG